jgi:TPR repeat protein
MRMISPKSKKTKPAEHSPAGTSGRAIFARAKNLYNMARRSEDYGQGFTLLKEAANLGLPEAHEWLGFVYQFGLGTRSNRRLAFKHYLEAADERHNSAEYQVGLAYYKGMGVAKDPSVGVTWIRRAARHGSASALYWLGWHYMSSDNQRRRRKGFNLLLTAANRKEIQAQHAVGVCYETGDCVPCDARAACRWYLQSAKGGYPYAAEALARCYETGIGVRISKRRSEFWQDRATDLWGQPGAGKP